MSEGTPAWVADAIFYQVFPDRFAIGSASGKPAHLEAWDALCREFPDRQDLRSDCAGTRRSLAEALERVGRGEKADSTLIPAGTSRDGDPLTHGADAPSGLRFPEMIAAA